MILGLKCLSTVADEEGRGTRYHTVVHGAVGAGMRLSALFGRYISGASLN